MVRLLFVCLLLVSALHAGTIPDVGETVPDAPLRGVDGAETSLKAARGGQASLVLFYRGGWCPYCNTHLSEVADIQGKLAAKGIRVLAISPDKPEELAKTLEKNTLTYTLLSDSSMSLSRAFGLAFTVDEKTLAKYDRYGIDLARASGETHRQLPVPAAFLLDAEGKVVWAHHDPDYTKRASAKELLKATEGLSTE